jgi:hypothetical protein
LKILSFNKDNFAQSLANKYTPKKIIEEKYHFLYLNEYLGEKGLFAKTMVIEEQYISRDFLYDYSSYYSYCFEEYSKFCSRIHFFSNTFDKKQFEAALLDVDNEIFWENYLGFVVVKPIPVTIIGITLLKTYSNNKAFGERYFWGIRNYKIHLFGKELNLETLAFQEQDSVLSACATTAIWSMLNKASKDDFTILKSPSEITNDADNVAFDGSRLFPNQGLDILQISQAIYNSGLVCEIKQPDYAILDNDGKVVRKVISNLYLKEIVNAYSPIGIPILLIIDVPDGSNYGLHAITVSGYKKSPPALIEPRDEITYLAENITKFYAHDDQWGPFERVLLKENIELVTPWTIFDEDQKPTFATNVIVPLFPKIRISYEDIKVIVLGIDAILTLFFGNKIKADLVWDIKIRYSENFKSLIRNNDSLSNKKKADYLYENCPKYLWNASCYIGEIKIYDFTFDATDVKSGMIGKHIISYLNNNINQSIVDFLRTNKSIFNSLFKHKASSMYYDFIIEQLSQ